MESKLQTQTLSHSGGGLKKKEWTVVVKRERKEEEESWPLIKKGFTGAQRKELVEQVLINRHISAGLPVPLNLVLPIWKSVVSSLGPSSSLLIYKQYPSFLGYTVQGFDCKTMMMDPEPGRCRRTDGKKWRCGRDVLSQQKYCERHIHRGRQRSRKLVEAPYFASPSGSSTTTTPNRPKKAGSPFNPDTNLSFTIASGGNDSGCYLTSPTCIGGTVTSAIASVKTGHDSSTTSNIIVRRNMSPGLCFSPKSVLISDPSDKSSIVVARRDGLFLGDQAHVVFEPGRCRRTDGKKWRCRREVVPDQKYCPRHMHRGVKKPFALSASSVAAPMPRPPAAVFESHRGPNTNLCISIPTSPPPNEKSSSSTSSDTTITDTSI